LQLTVVIECPKAPRPAASFNRLDIVVDPSGDLCLGLHLEYLESFRESHISESFGNKFPVYSERNSAKVQKRPNEVKGTGSSSSPIFRSCSDIQISRSLYELAGSLTPLLEVRLLL